MVVISDKKRRTEGENELLGDRLNLLISVFVASALATICKLVVGSQQKSGFPEFPPGAQLTPQFQLPLAVSV